jgi:hypothetical protein
MTDGLGYTPGTGAEVATDDCGAAGHTQIIKLAGSTDGDATLLPATTARGLSVDPRLKVVRLSATPTISTTAYTAGDAVGGLLTFSGAARASGGSIRVETVQVVDASKQLADLDLLLFDRSITAPTDNAVFAPSTTELGYCVGFVPLGGGFYSSLNANAVASVPVGQSCLLSGTDLFGVLVARSAPTYTTTSALVVTVTGSQD